MPGPARTFSVRTFTMPFGNAIAAGALVTGDGGNNVTSGVAVSVGCGANAAIGMRSVVVDCDANVGANVAAKVWIEVTVAGTSMAAGLGFSLPHADRQNRASIKKQVARITR